ncbi:MULTISPECIES: phage holin [Exiguobacterium]|uniref:phage holin n=1 Tax=Exiguobacterium TaxID=33986 RepID=UPI00047E7BC7|nr:MULTISPECIES: phage holin [Exiguobacterium]MCT4781387.1 SPP1 phage holin family protein [Exiguobacterium soli]
MKSRYVAVLRLLVPLYSFVNLTLLALGYTRLPFETPQVETALTAGLGASSLIYAWWKNNNLTHSAEQAQEWLRELKQQKSKRSS